MAAPGEPIDHRAPGNKAEQERRVQNGEHLDILRKSAGEHHDGREDHRGGADHSGADQHGLGGCLKGITRAVVFFQILFAFSKVGDKTKVLP